MPRAIYKSHNIGDPKCTQLSSQDRDKLNSRLSSMACQEETDDRQLAAAFGYDMDLIEHENVVEQVNNSDESLENLASNISKFRTAKLGYIKPEPTQLLTVYNDEQNKITVHIELDSGATLNYIRESEAFRLFCKILPNGQLSTLGDGLTKLGSVGEIDVTFFRNNWKVRFRAVVVKHLQSPILGGTVFLKDNKIEQNLYKQVSISLFLYISGILYLNISYGMFLCYNLLAGHH